MPSLTSTIESTPATDAVELCEIADDPHFEILVRQLRERHWTMLAVALFIVAASFALQLHGSETVALPWLNMDIPSMCGSRSLLGVECPGCGLTRSFIALAAGDVQASLQFNRVGWLMAFAVLAQFPYRILALRELRTTVVRRVWPVWFGYILIATLIVNWLIKMFLQ